uniref:Uncharacterized protein n=1 Tax=Octopus bimaculoides TaxID=37653 RepID=A0A0L8GLN6_OCTBM
MVVLDGVSIESIKPWRWIDSLLKHQIEYLMRFLFLSFQTATTQVPSFVSLGVPFFIFNILSDVRSGDMHAMAIVGLLQNPFSSVCR